MAPIIRPEEEKGIPGALLRDLQRRPALGALLRDVARAVSRARGAMYLAGGYLRDLAEGRHGGDVDLLVTGISFPRQEIMRAKEALRNQVADLAVAGAAKILKREVDAKAHADLLAAIRQKL